MKRKTWLVATLVCGVLLCFMSLVLTLGAAIIYKGYVGFFLPSYAGPVWPFWVLWAYFLAWTLFIIPVEFMILNDDIWQWPFEKFGEFVFTGVISVFLWWWMLFVTDEGQKLLRILKLKR